MRLLDWIGFLFMAAGLSGVWIGHHYFGPIWFWGGMALVFVGVSSIWTSARSKRLEQSMREYQGPGDGGSRQYHSGSAATFGSDGGDGD